MGTCLQVIHHGSNTLLERKAVKKTETARFPAVRGGATKPRGEPAPAQMTGPREAVVAGAAEETTSRGGDALLRQGGLGQGRRSQDGAHERRGDADTLLTATTRDRGRAHGHGTNRGLGGAGGPPLGPSGAWGWLFLTSNNPGLRGRAARGPRPRCVALGGTAPAWDLVSPHLTTALRGVALWPLGCGRQRAAQPLSRGPKRDGRGARRGGGGPRLSAAAEPGLGRNSVALWPPGS